MSRSALMSSRRRVSPHDWNAAKRMSGRARQWEMSSSVSEGSMSDVSCMQAPRSRSERMEMCGMHASASSV
eukprot:2208417-Pleurochrysis_carterae.AAC.2